MPFQTSDLFGRRTARLLAGSAIGLALGALGSTDALAACAPSPAGTAGPDVITCTPGGSFAVVLGRADADQITNNGDDLTGIVGGGGNDIITHNSGTTALGIYGDHFGDVFGDIPTSTPPGDDTVFMTGGTVTNGIFGETGNDVIAFSGGVVGDLGSGGRVFGGLGNDTLAMSGGTLVNALATDFAMFGEAGDDLITLSGGSATGVFSGGADNDRVVISGGVHNGAVFGEGGDDTLEFSGGTQTLAIGGGDENDTIAISNTAVVQSQIAGEAANDTLVMSGGQLTGAGNGFAGGEGNDQVLMSGGVVDGGAVGFFGETGQDAFVLSGGSLTGNIAGQDDDDTLYLSNTARVTGNFFGGDGAEIVDLFGGTLTGNVNGESGNDVIQLSGAEVTGELQGSFGLDRLFVASGTLTGNMNGNDGDDSLLLSGGQITGNMLGESGVDLFQLSGTGTLSGNLLAGEGGDSIDLVSANLVSGTISGEAGNDTIFVRDFFSALSGVDRMDGGAGDDTYIMRQMVGQLGSGFEGFENIILDNAGLDVFDGANDIRIIQADAGGPVSMALLVGSGIFAGGNGTPGQFTLVGNLGNDNSVLDLEEGAADDLVVITGNYAGTTTALAETQLRVDAALDASNDGDLLVILGAITDVTVQGNLIADGTTLLVVNDVGSGVGILTGRGPGLGIKVVDVSNTGGTDITDFALIDGPIQAGAVEYDLYLESDNNWYLQSAFLNQVFGYAAAPSAALAMGQEYLGSLRERVGTREQTWTGGAVQSSEGAGAWMRGGGSSEQVSDGNGFDYDQDRWFAQVGADFPLLLDPSGAHLVGGLFAQYGTSEITAQDELGADAATANLSAWGGGLSLTWYGTPGDATGFYADLVGQISVYDADFKSTSSGATGDTNGWGWGISLEAGWGFTVADQVRLIPQAQLSYSRVSLDSFTDDDGVDVDYGDADSLEARVGVAVDTGKLWRAGNVTFTANVVHEFLGESELGVSTLDAGTDLSGTSAEMGLGGTVSLLDNVSLYGTVDYRVPFDQGREGVTAAAGVRLSW